MEGNSAGIWPVLLIRTSDDSKLGKQLFSLQATQRPHHVSIWTSNINILLNKLKVPYSTLTNYFIVTLYISFLSYFAHELPAFCSISSTKYREEFFRCALSWAHQCKDFSVLYCYNTKRIYMSFLRYKYKVSHFK